MENSKTYPQEDRKNNLDRIAQVKNLMSDGYSFTRACTVVSTRQDISVQRIYNIISNYIERGIVEEFRPKKLGGDK